MTGLLVTQQIARSANVEIVTGKLKACAQAVEIAENLQALFSDFRKLRVLRISQIGVSAQLRPADTPSQLIKLRQSEDVGPVDDDGVGTREIVVASRTSYLPS